MLSISRKCKHRAVRRGPDRFVARNEAVKCNLRASGVTQGHRHRYGDVVEVNRHDTLFAKAALSDEVGGPLGESDCSASSAGGSRVSPAGAPAGSPRSANTATSAAPRLRAELACRSELSAELNDASGALPKLSIKAGADVVGEFDSLAVIVGRQLDGLANAASIVEQVEPVVGH
jgi:hypothetical protein